MSPKCPAVDVLEGPHRLACPDPPLARLWVRLGDIGTSLAWVALDVCPRHAATLVADVGRPLEVLEPPGARG